MFWNISKRIFSIGLFCIALTGSALSSGAWGKHLVIGLSPNTDRTTLATQATAVLNFALSQPGGSRITFMDAYHGRLLGTLVIPTKATYASIKARKKYGQNTEALRVIIRFVKAPPTMTPMPSISGAVDAPTLLRRAAELYPTQNGSRTDVLILGSSLHDVAAYPQFSMAKGLVPSDAHLMASGADSVFSAVDSERFQGLRIHWVYSDQQRFSSNREAFYIERFWSLYTTQQNGEWVTYSNDLKAAMQRIREKSPAIPQVNKVETHAPFEMRHYEDDRAQESIFGENVENSSTNIGNIERLSDVRIAINWACQSCDVDLHVRPFPTAKTLNFKRRTTEQGEYEKDFRNSPSSGFEIVTLHGEVNLSALQIGLHLYNGQSKQGVNGTIRISANGKTFEQPFLLTATSGKAISDITDSFDAGRSLNLQTLLINPLSVLKQP